MVLHFFSCRLCVVHTYSSLLEPDMAYAPLRADQMDNVALDVSLDEDTSSMDDIPPKCSFKPQKKNKGKTLFFFRLCRNTERVSH